MQKAQIQTLERGEAPRRYLIPANYREVFTPSEIAAAETAMDLLITVAIRAERAEQAQAAQQ